MPILAAIFFIIVIIIWDKVEWHFAMKNKPKNIFPPAVQRAMDEINNPAKNKLAEDREWFLRENNIKNEDYLTSYYREKGDK